MYMFNVYNSGETGPKATYRLEVDPTVLPYKILRPYLPAEGIVNKNYVDVIINAKGADKVTIKKQRRISTNMITIMTVLLRCGRLPECI